jgi:hypothetical protein
MASRPCSATPEGLEGEIYSLLCIDRPRSKNVASKNLKPGEAKMARYGKAAGKSVKRAIDREKRGTLKSGPGGKGGTVVSRKQAIAIGLAEARKKGAKVPGKQSS